MTPQEQAFADYAKRNPDVGADLRMIFPHLFESGLPFAVGIKAAIRDEKPEHLSMKRVSAWLKEYASRPEYLKAVADGCLRVDLDGNLSGEIVETEKVYSRKELAKLERKAKRNK